MLLKIQFDYLNDLKSLGFEIARLDLKHSSFKEKLL